MKIRIVFTRINVWRIAVFGLFLAVFGTILLISSRFIYNIYASEIGMWMIIASTFCFAAASVMYTAYKLNIFGDVDYSSNTIDRIDYLENKLSELQDEKMFFIIQNQTNRFEKIARDVFNASIKSNIKTVLGEKIIEITKEKILEDYKPSIFKDSIFNSLSTKLSSYVDGMSKQIEVQRRGAAQNLVWGIFFAISGLFIMGFFVVAPYWYARGDSQFVTSDWSAFFQSFLPKLTFVLIFESVSFFFLKAYAEDRNALKYLRNELTNMELKSAAVLSAIYVGDEELLSVILDKLVLTERNFTVKKGDRVISEILFRENNILIEEILKSIVDKIKVKA